MAKAVNRSKRKTQRYFDYNLLFITIFLCIFGLIMIYSAGSYDSMGAKRDLIKQTLIIGVAAVGTAIAMKAPFEFYKKISPYVLIGCMLMIFLTRTPLGHTSHGASRWLFIGPISIQPAEIVKLGVILFVAAVICSCKDKMNNRNVVLLITIPVLLFFILILFVTNNLSSAIIIAVIAIGMYFTAHPSWKQFLIFAGVAVLLYVMSIILLESIDVSNMNLDDLGNFRFERLIAWRHPEAFSDDQSMQTLNALYAIGSGGLFGSGLGTSIQKDILPESQNDMIFAIVCEELGLFGAFLLIALYIGIFYRMVFVARNTSNTFGAYVTVGVFIHFAMQVILNIGVATNVLPNTGVTLPFISNGGSAVAILIFEIGLVLKASRYIVVPSQATSKP